MSTTRIPPVAAEAEKALLGAMMVRNAIIGEAAQTLDPADFHRPAHQRVYATMIDLHDRGQVADPITIHSIVGNEVIRLDELSEMLASIPSVSAWGSYANQIIDASRRRLAIGHFSEIIDGLYRHGTVTDEVLAEHDPNTNRLIAPRLAEVAGLYDIGEFMDMAERTEAARPWISKGLFKPRWRTIIVAAEGVGKGVLMRQLALHIAAGRDPWGWADEEWRFQPPARTLYVDAENPLDAIQSQFKIASKNPDVLKDAIETGMLHLWWRENGMDLRQRRHRAEFEAVLQKVRPEIVFMGPMYKLFRRAKNEDMEQVAIEVAEVFDDLRVRYDFALVLEHHAPSASGGGYREIKPFGSSVWQRWPEFGIALDVKNGASMTSDRYEVEVGRFRRDRLVADWPTELTRGTSASVAWHARFEHGRGNVFKPGFVR